MEEKKPIRPALVAMQTGDREVFPIKRLCSVRAVASMVGLELDRQYSTKTNRERRTITVIRVN